MATITTTRCVHCVFVFRSASPFGSLTSVARLISPTSYNLNTLYYWLAKTGKNLRCKLSFRERTLSNTKLTVQIYLYKAHHKIINNKSAVLSSTRIVIFYCKCHQTTADLSSSTTDFDEFTTLTDKDFEEVTRHTFHSVPIISSILISFSFCYFSI